LANISYKSFCWNIGTTSFRTKNFNKTIEEQLILLNEFWSLEENQDSQWSKNETLQSRYYDFMKNKGFIQGDARHKSKDAREKTSGLVDIGLINDERKLSAVGLNLLTISKTNDFAIDNFLQIPKDSYIYLKQLLKTHNTINGKVVRPFIILLYVLSKLQFLSLDEYIYLLPLCINQINTDKIIKNIQLLRSQTVLTLDDAIIDILMSMDNYKEALILLLNSNMDEDLFCKIGINRKSRDYDKVYFNLYMSLYTHNK
jgi:hypothetical protein